MGDFSVWEFSGNPAYYCAYDYFAADDATALHLVVFSLEEPYESQLSHVGFWLNTLKALTPPPPRIRESLRFGPLFPPGGWRRRSHAVPARFAVFGGRVRRPPVVVLVATHADLADLPRCFSGEFSYKKERALLKEVRSRSGIWGRGKKGSRCSTGAKNDGCFSPFQVWKRPADQRQVVCDGHRRLQLQRHEAAEEPPAGAARAPHLGGHRHTRGRGVGGDTPLAWFRLGVNLGVCAFVAFLHLNHRVTFAPKRIEK